MSKLKFYQIVMPDNEASMEYHEISKASFECVSDIIEIIPFEAITPQHPDFEEHQSRYNWQWSLMTLDNKDKKLRFDFEEPHSPTERAGMCSHWELMRLASLTEERFWVTEHDTYLWPEHEDVFRYLVSIVGTRNLEYANIGLFMGCYSFNRDLAHHSYHLLSQKQFPINCGPFGVLERLYKTYCSLQFEKSERYKLKEFTFLHPWANGDSLRFGKSKEEMFDTYNKFDRDIFPHLPRSFWSPNPTTQVVKKDLMVTQEHRLYPESMQMEPWKRSPRFKVID